MNVKLKNIFLKNLFNVKIHVDKQKMLFYSALLMLLLLQNQLLAQMADDFSLNVGLHYGEILKHTPKLTFSVPTQSIGSEINLQLRRSGKKDWHEWQNYPKVGLMMLFYNLGDKQVLGDAYGIAPNINIYWLRRNKWNAFVQVGAGMAYLTKPYNTVDNPLNNAIGSHIDNISHVKIGSEIRLSMHWKVQAAFSFTHFSNGAAQLPNYGLNIPAFNLNAIYSIRDNKEPLLASKIATPEAEKKWGINMHTGFAFKESFSIGGPRYPIYIASLSGLYRTSMTKKTLVGVDYEFNYSVYKFGYHIQGFLNNQQARDESRRIALTLGEEFTFGDCGILLQVGYYVSKKSFLIPFPVYSKLACRYYFPAIGKIPTRFHAGVYLKAHLITAEYFGINIGTEI